MIVALIVAAGAFVQSVTGFGMALVTMPLLASVVDVRVATPLIAVLGFGSNVALLIRHRTALRVGSVWRLTLAAAVSIPLGVAALRTLDPRPVTGTLGVVVVVYALYALTGPRLPKLQHPAWAWGAGFTAGLLSGAYNTSGPPVVIYGSCRRWAPDVFRANLQAFFLVNGLIGLPSHAIAGSFDSEVGVLCLLGLPGLLAGLALGRLVDPLLDADRFRKIVLCALVLLGGRLAWG